MRILIRRTKMIGGGLSYSVLVPVADIPHYDSTRWSTLVYDDGRYWDFDRAIEPDHIREMPRGLARYDAWLSHEKEAATIAYTLALPLFPELAKVGKIPVLWATDLLETESSADRWIEYMPN